jgi:uncharacterized protein (UPF0333 family)
MKKNSGQAMVEFILVFCALLLASYGAVRLIGAAWKVKYNGVVATRTGFRGQYP